MKGSVYIHGWETSLWHLSFIYNSHVSWLVRSFIITIMLSSNEVKIFVYMSIYCYRDKSFLEWMCIHYEHKYCIQLTLEKPLFPIQFHYSTVFYLFLGVADSYIQISSGFVQLATIENTELDKYVEFGPRQANLVLIAYASSEGSGEPAHPRSLARTFAPRSHKQ